MKTFLLVLGLLLSFFLQVNFLSSLSLFSVTFNLVLIFLIYVSIYRNWKEALFLSLLGGLLLDLILSELFGLHLLFFLLVAFITVLFKRETNFENLPFILFFTAVFSFVYGLIWAGVLYFRRIPVDMTFLKLISLQITLTLVFVLLFHFILVRFFARIKILDKA